MKISRLFGDCAKNEHVGRDHGNERDDEHEENGQAAVELLLPFLIVRPVGDALVELFNEGASLHPEYVRLQGDNGHIAK